MEQMEAYIRYQQWAKATEMEPELKKELDEIEGNEEEIFDRFYQDLEFGTAGMRGIMGAGTNRMNVYTVQRASAGLALYLLSTYGLEAMQRGVVIAYDSRHKSAEFAREAGLTLNSLGIRVYVFDRITPTPELSFAVGYRKAIAGIVITASHNAKEYNGYKVYNEFGSQIVEEAAEQILEKMSVYQDLSQLPVMLNYQDAVNQDLYHELGGDYHMAYQKAVLKQSLLNDNAAKDSLKVVYTPLHGAGLKTVLAVLEKSGFSDISVVPSQKDPDGDFPTVKKPNPEEAEAMQPALDYAKTLNADIVLATDPDSDRLGVAVKDGAEYCLLNGNQTGALLADYVLSQSELPENPVMIKTVVTSDLGAQIASAHGVEVMNVLTGFKYIGEKMIDFAKKKDHNFVLGYEESYGYLVGEYAKDKDGVVASMLIAEMAAYYKKQGKTLLDRLQDLYETYGYYREELECIVLPGADGKQRMDEMMQILRAKPFEKVGNETVTEVKDYNNEIDGLPKSNVLKYFFGEDGWMAVRPSGTEPKIKFYYSVRSATMEESKQRIAALKETVKEFFA